ncbi:MAG: TrkA family potassium uptake protein [Planctomycetes bacterium]|nr:TrkA family potassium uptake protein [Planctomycetota bacterium]
MMSETMTMQRFAVIGLGRFGSRLAINLSRSGAEVLAIDKNRELVESLSDQVTVAVCLDATDERALRQQGLDKIDCAVVSIGDDFEANVLTTVLLKHLRVKTVIARAASYTQGAIQSRIGADAVVNPEDEAADRWAHRLLAPFMIEHVEIAAGYGLIQLPTPVDWQNKTLLELDLRSRFRVNVVAVKKGKQADPDDVNTEPEEFVVVTPMPDTVLLEGDILVLAGVDDDLEKLPH